MNESDPADVLAMMTGRPHNLTCKQKEAFRMESLFFTRYTKQLEIAAGGVSIRQKNTAYSTAATGNDEGYSSFPSTSFLCT